jgi:hypothetical protein
MTARTSLTLRAHGLHFAIYLGHGHRLDPGFGHALSDREKRVGRLPALDCIGEQPVRAPRLLEAPPRARRSPCHLTARSESLSCYLDWNALSPALLPAESQ